MIGVVFFLLLMLGGGVAQAQVASPMLAPPVVVRPMDVPNGGPPQIVGFSLPNVPESETVIGDVTFARTGTSQYTATVHSVNGITAGNVATLNVGTGLTVGAGSMLDLIIPVPISSGGTGTTTVPTADQILIAQTATACGGSPCYLPMPVGGDITIATNGVVTVHEIGGVVPGGTCGPNQFVNHVSASGVPTCTTPAITGIPPGTIPQIVAYSGTDTVESATVSGGPGGCGFTRTGANAYQMNCTTYAPLNSPTFTGTVTMPDAGTWNSTGLTATKGTFSGDVTAADISAAHITVNSGIGGYFAAAGAAYHQPGWNATTQPAVWTQKGLDQIQQIGIGQPILGSDPLDITVNQNSPTRVMLLNNNSGNGAGAGYFVSNGTNTAHFGIYGTGAVSPNNAVLIADQGLFYQTGNSLPHQFYVNGAVQATIASNGLHLTSPLEVGSGGTGTQTEPTQNQILVAQSATAYAPRTVSGDLTLNSIGQATVGTSGNFLPQLYVGDLAACGIQYQPTDGLVGYYTRVGKQIVAYFTIRLASLGSCTNAPLMVAVPGNPTLQGISMDLIQISQFTPGGGVPAGGILVAQGNAQTVGAGVVFLGTLVNGTVYQILTQNIAPNSVIRGRVVYNTD